VNILERTVQFEREPAGFYANWEPQERELSQDIANARTLLEDVTYTQRDMFTIAGLTSEMHVDGHRADIVILKSAIAHAAFGRRTYVTDEDILAAAELALPHRLKRHPFQDTEIQFQELAERLDQVRQEAAEQTTSMQAVGDAPSSPQEKKTIVTR
jgi:Mg-chelatase subunit ChlI